MVSFMIQGLLKSQEVLNSNLRMVFLTDDHTVVPAVYCQDLFAEQIASEKKNGEQDEIDSFSRIYNDDD